MDSQILTHCCGKPLKALLALALLWQTPAVVAQWVATSTPGLALCPNEPAPRYAQSPDGAWRLHFDPQTSALQLTNAQGQRVRDYAVPSQDGRTDSGVRAVYAAHLRHSFVVVLRDLPELWEISYDPGAEPIYDGLVHDYRMAESLGRTGQFGVRKTLLDAPLGPLWWDVSQSFVVSWDCVSSSKPLLARVVQLDVRRQIAQREWSPATRSDADGERKLDLPGRTLRLHPARAASAAP